MSKKALVTGASSGLGQAIAIQLAQDGYQIFVHFNSNESGALETLEKVKYFQPNSTLIQFNIQDSTDVESKLKEVEVDVLINNAGLHKDGMAALMSNDQFESVIQTNLFGTFYVTRVLSKKMLIKRNGKIIFISSLAGQVGNAGQLNYAASKAAIISMTKTLAREFGPRGIQVNGIAPGIIETEMITDIPKINDLKKEIPLGRFGTAQEIANVVSFLCSEKSSYIHGHTLSVNGGLYPS